MSIKLGTTVEEPKLKLTSQNSSTPWRALELREIFYKLLNHFGPQKWWPAETKFEVIIGAILTQNTAWNNVERAIDSLKKANKLSLEAIYNIDKETLELIIKPVGFFRKKAKHIKDFVDYIIKEWHGSIDDFLDQPIEDLRSNLLKIKGIGYETADTIILYAAYKPSFVVDRYTHRVMFRHGYASEKYHYERLREFFMKGVPHDVYIFQEYHALFVQLGKQYCGKVPKCENCPLRYHLSQS